jgi:integrase
MIKVRQIQKHGETRWEADVQVSYPDGTRSPRKRVILDRDIASEEQAYEFAEQFALNLRGQNLIKTHPTLREFFEEEFLPHVNSKEVHQVTKNRYRRAWEYCIPKNLQKKQLNKITSKDWLQVNSAIDKLRSKSTRRNGELISNGTKNIHKIAITAIVDHAIKCGYKVAKPDTTLIRSQWHTDESYTKLAYPQDVQEKLTKYSESHVERLMIVLGLRLGLRRSEAAAVDKTKVVYDEKSQAWTLRVNEHYVSHDRKIVQGTKHSRTGRIIIITEEIAQDIIVQYSARNNKKLNYWTLPNALLNLYMRAVPESDGKDCNYHRLRHSCATRLANSGMPLIQVRDLLGHKNITTTMMYVHKDSTAAKAAAEKWL